MGSKQSTANSPSRVVQADENSGTIGGSFSSTTPYRNSRSNDTDQLNNARDLRQRARSLTTVLSSDPRQSHSGAIDVFSPFGISTASPSDIISMSSNDDNASPSFGSFTAHSLPVHFFPFNGFKCPFCSKMVMPDDVECHLVMCITKPPLNYNDDILTEDKEECVICLEEMLKGNKIARLPCLCIYHKKCIDDWFEVNRSCPEHPAY